VPTVKSISSPNDVTRCNVDTLEIEGDFNVSDARLIVDAFDVPIWYVMVYLHNGFLVFNATFNNISVIW
jgi:hypothetical protein